MRPVLLGLAMLLTAGGAFAGPAAPNAEPGAPAAETASPPARASNQVDHERARRAMEAGEIIPLHDILAKVDSKFNGRVIEVKLTDLDEGLHGWIYAVSLLTPQDNLLVLKVDAGTGVILQVEGHGIEEARKAQ